MSIIFGYAGINTYLSDFGIKTNRTVRQDTVKIKKLQFIEDLAFKNLSDLLKTLQWNNENDIKLFRMGSGMFPHITNENLFYMIEDLSESKKDNKDITKLLYPLEKFEKYFKILGNFAKNNNLILTFHPDLFCVLNSNDMNITIKTYRDLYVHAKILDLMGLEPESGSLIILHGGGVYGNKNDAMDRFIINYKKMPDLIKKYIVIENDETNYSVDDCLWLANQCKIPFLLDLFHHYCYDIYYETKFGSKNQSSITIEFLKKIEKTWKYKFMKFHISEQADGKILGAHSDYIKKIPEILIEFSKINVQQKLLVMVEAKMKEQAVLNLKKLYFKI